MTIGVGTRVVKVETNHQPISQERGDHSINPEVLEKPVRRQFTVANWEMLESCYGVRDCTLHI